MKKNTIPYLSDNELEKYLENAKLSIKKRYPKILHKTGDKFNQVFNFMMKNSYMQPHLHPGPEKIEHIHILKGEIATIFFNEEGQINEFTILKPGGIELVKVPAFTWNTYVVLTEKAVTYETMMGIYDIKTWKNFANWTPKESSKNSFSYLKSLKNSVNPSQRN